MTNPQRWPYVAKDARDRAAEYLNVALHHLEPMVTDEAMSETERVRRLSVAVVMVQKSIRLLESVGAQTRP